MDIINLTDKVLSHDDEIFLGNVATDIQSYIDSIKNNPEKKTVLLFPPVNNYRRFLIHHLIDQYFHLQNLTTLSIGTFYSRRTAVFPSSLKPLPKNLEKTSPVLGKVQSKIKTHSVTSKDRMRKTRKPDIQIYVPRGRRLLDSNQNKSSDSVDPDTLIDLTTDSQQSCGSKRTCDELLNTSSNSDNFEYNETDMLNYEHTEKLPEAIIHICDNDEERIENNELLSSNTKPCNETVDPEKSVNIASDSFELSGISSCSDQTECLDESLRNPDGIKCMTDSSIIVCDDNDDIRTEKVANTIDNVESINQNINLSNNSRVSIATDDDWEKSVSKTHESHKSSKETDVHLKPHENEHDACAIVHEKCVIPFDTSTKSKSSTNSLLNMDSVASEKTDSKKSDEKTTKSKCKNPINIDDCDWEDLIDDSGDFVNKSLVDELMSAIGKVHVQEASQDYRQFQTEEERSSDGECIIEIYGFSSDFKTDDLMTIFAHYRTDQGFQIVWVDDTHALAVFSSPLIADDVLNTELPFVKTRSLKNAIPKSRMKARNFVPTPATRPKTCVSLARRLVSGHLGMKINVPDKQREAERKLLSDAREKRRQITKQKVDVWECTSHDDQ